MKQNWLGFLLIFAGIAQAAPVKTKEISKGKTKLESIVLAGGCFWGVQDLIRKLPGVIKSEVGYSGGDKPNPTYEDVKTGVTGYAESVRIEFDPKVIDLEHLLTYFFRLHDPTTVNQQGNDRGTQYRSAIFYANDEQKKVAEKSKLAAGLQGRWKKPIVTEITPFHSFTRAEEYHQDYLVKHPDGYTCHYVRD